jgi:hypothetical protein
VLSICLAMRPKLTRRRLHLLPRRHSRAAQPICSAVHRHLRTLHRRARSRQTCLTRIRRMNRRLCLSLPRQRPLEPSLRASCLSLTAEVTVTRRHRLVRRSSRPVLPSQPRCLRMMISPRCLPPLPLAHRLSLLLLRLPLSLRSRLRNQRRSWCLTRQSGPRLWSLMWSKPRPLPLLRLSRRSHHPSSPRSRHRHRR